ncbi:MAG: hypothetical protein WCO60_18420 [Verrucomicrobiota bacterium]
MKSETQSLRELDAKLNAICFGKQEEESHTGRNIAIAGLGAGAVGAGGYYANKKWIQPEKAALEAGQVMGAAKEAHQYADSLGLKGIDVSKNPVAQKFMPAPGKVTTVDAMKSVATRGLGKASDSFRGGWDKLAKSLSKLRPKA